MLCSENVFLRLLAKCSKDSITVSQKTIHLTLDLSFGKYKHKV